MFYIVYKLVSLLFLLESRIYFILRWEGLDSVKNEFLKSILLKLFEIYSVFKL